MESSGGIGYHDRVMHTLKEKLEKINTHGLVRADEPMSRHTTFGIGGPADLFIVPSGPDELTTTVRFLEAEGVPFFILGGGANILVADRGIRGAVIHTGKLNGIQFEGTDVIIGAGEAVSDAAQAAAGKGLGGLQFLYGMPGSVGGAVWMNARCYGAQVDQVLTEVEHYRPGIASASHPNTSGAVTHTGVSGQEKRPVERDDDSESDGDDDGTDPGVHRYIVDPKEFGYKVSPFQTSHSVILRVRFRLYPADPRELEQEMRHYKADRESKGHYTAPCAGSVFKNNREFGYPSGVLIDRTGIKGVSIGDAQISPWHANIFINRGTATAADMLRLIQHAEDAVMSRFGFRLDREVQLVGSWDE
jgi:UDP-N-acetylmuramate dehydrogenase